MNQAKTKSLYNRSMPTVVKGVGDFVVLAMCLECDERWLGVVATDTALFALECPECRKTNSFASFVPEHFMEEAEGGVQPEMVH